MCKTYSCIITQTYNVLDCENSDSHEDIISKHELKDDLGGELRRFVRAEYSPLASLSSLDQSDWEYQLDEESTPDWYDDEKARSAAWRKLRSAIKAGRYKNFGGDLDLRGTQVEDLGVLTSVGGCLYLRGTKIKDLGVLTSVGGDLDLGGTKIKDLGNIKVHDTIYS